MFHPSVVVPTTYNTAAGPRLFPGAIKPVGNGTWQCSPCHKQRSVGDAGKFASGGRSKSGGGAAAAAEGATVAAVAIPDGGGVDHAAILKQASALLAKLPTMHWGSIVGTRLAALVKLEKQYAAVYDSDSTLPGLGQVRVNRHPGLPNLSTSRRP